MATIRKRTLLTIPSLDTAYGCMHVVLACMVDPRLQKIGAIAGYYCTIRTNPDLTDNHAGAARDIDGVQGNPS